MAKNGRGGFFPAENHLELINGETIEMAPIGSHHAGLLKGLNNFFQDWFNNLLLFQLKIHYNLVTCQNLNLTLCCYFHDQVFIIKNTLLAKDVFLLIEIADKSLTYESKYKITLYA
ncbi:MAG: Uma2 family endonuclease [Methylococcaceae bacterium]|nr:Uma2 family endonuclease [Methylococcaceae bacterium]